MQKVLFSGALLCAAGVQLPLSEAPLRVFAATFNAGNSVAPHILSDNSTGSRSFLHGRDQILRGSGAADIVVVGLQEFRDGGESRAEGEASSLFAPADPDHFENFRVTHYSGHLCHAASHYNTALYVRVRKRSGWVIAHRPHGTADCVIPEHEPKLGCSIDNNERIEWGNLTAELKKKRHGIECGKAVNLLVFEVRRASGGDPAALLCVMNTHMSFAGTAEDRMGYIASAMGEAEKAKCDRVVFVGDFNSRLHCHGEEEHASGAHPGGQTVKSILHEICGHGDGACHLGGHRDELRQLLTSARVTCHEKKQGTSAVTNTVIKHGYYEPEVPRFFPSYKLVNTASIRGCDHARMQRSDDISCRGAGDGETMCIGNKDGGDKHKPAWTDRVLIKGDVDSAKVTYERRLVAKGFKTDHAAVVAQFAFDIPR